MESRSFETKLALVDKNARDLIVVSFRARAVFDDEGLAECLAACDELTSISCVQLWEIPEDADFCPSFVRRDHFASMPLGAVPSALAVVSSNGFLNRLLAIYFAYHPQGFPVAYFHERQLALDWLGSVTGAQASRS